MIWPVNRLLLLSKLQAYKFFFKNPHNLSEHEWDLSNLLCKYFDPELTVG